MDRLLAVKPVRRDAGQAVPSRSLSSLSEFPGLWRWLVPATAVIMAGLIIWRIGFSRVIPSKTAQPAADSLALKADDVQISEQLVSSFDTVAKLPTGEPFRFRCQKWVDQVVLSDKKRGVTIERRRPRVEVVPVGFETY